ncbi:TIM-barrel domain-containing protein [Planctomycetota bacterium]
MTQKYVFSKKRLSLLQLILISLLFSMAIFISSTSAEQLGKITSFVEKDNQFAITTDDGAATKVIFYRADIFRIWIGPNAELTDPAGDEETPIVVYGGNPIKVSQSEEIEYYKIESASCVLRVYKSPCRFALYQKDNTTMIFEEASPIIYGEAIPQPEPTEQRARRRRQADTVRSYQTIKRNSDDYFYGCGMQNGHFNHNDNDVNISSTGSWNEEGHPNAVPFYMSLRGYGAFRNTYARGIYSFKDPVKTTHNENRFDCYYFYGPSLKKIIDGYTLITGRPFMTPMWAMEFGDADRYEDGTYECVSYADKYIDNDIPVGWFLPNDGYRMNFERFPEVQDELEKRNIYTGMWTDEGREFEKIVKEWGVRLFKLDIAWVGRGYKFSLNACRQCYDHIENNSDARGVLWVTLGWAGSQRYTIMWTGDNSGSLDWIRWHIPTVTGSGFSAQNGATGDVEGIYGGDKITYVRDLQWKCYTPFMMIIDNWSKHEKKPFSYGDPYTAHNRKALKLKSRLMPYLYSYSYECHQSGVPVQRALVLEFPNDSNTWEEVGDNAKTKYQFMSGESFLVAPVYEDTDTWNVYLPKGKWTDFENGKIYQGGQTITDYDVSDFKLPVLVKEGAIIPMYPEAFYENRKQQRPRDPLQVDIYPHTAKATSFTLFEDDGLTYKFKEYKFNKTLFTCDATSNKDVIQISVNGCAQGEGYEGMPQERNYYFTVHDRRKPQSVAWASSSDITNPLDEVNSTRALEGRDEGWCFLESNEGVLHIKLKPQDYNARIKIKIIVTF